VANLMFGRQHFGRYRFAAPVLRVGGVVVEYPYIPGHIAIDFYDAEGIRTESIVSDMAESPLMSVEFELNQNGCAQFNFKLKADHGITIAYNQRIDIRLFGDPQPWYSGYVQTRPVTGTTEPIWEYTGYGYFGQIERVIVNRSYTATEISQIVRNIVTTDIEPNTGARYNSSKIYSTGYTASALTFDYSTAKDALKQLSEFAVNFIYGVDEYRDVYFKAITTEINENSRFWVGHHVEKFIPEEDISTVINYIYVQGGELDAAGSNIMYECSDATSIAAYGKRAAVLSIPSAYSDTDATRWGDNELDKAKNPKRTAKIDKIKPEIIRRKIKPEGMARITTFDGLTYYDYPIQKVKYKASGEGITMTMELGEYVKGIEQIILKMTRDAKNAELLQRGNNAQLVS
jgi:hypothetical protein